MLRPSIVLIAFAASLSGTSAADPAVLEVAAMTFNIRLGVAKDGENHWDHRKNMVFDVINDHDPDVLGLQEAWKFQIDEILDAHSGYTLVGRSREADEEKGEWCPILFRSAQFDLENSGTFWLSDTPEEEASKSWGNGIPRICTWVQLTEIATKRQLFVFNTHWDHQSQPSRVASARLCLERIAKIAEETPVLLMGDLNAGEDNEAISTLVDGGLRDTFRSLYPDEIMVGTFNGWSGRAEGAKIDYIWFFRDNESQVIDAQIIRTHNASGKYPSDHFPLSATVQWN